MAAMTKEARFDVEWLAADQPPDIDCAGSRGWLGKEKGSTAPAVLLPITPMPEDSAFLAQGNDMIVIQLDIRDDVLR